MSDTILEEKTADTDKVSVEDLKRMLDESRSRETELSRAVEEQRAQRMAAEAERDTASSRVVSETEQRWAAQRQAVEGALSAAEAEAESAERDYAEAAQNGEWAVAAKAQRKMAAAETKAAQFRNQKDYLETNKAKLTAVQPQPSRSDSSDKYAGVVQGLQQKEREWLDQRPQFLNDPKYRTKVFGASQIADAEHGRGSADYFRRMEELLGESRSEAEPEREPAKRPMSSDMAPQRRATPNAAPAGAREIRLTADQVEIANALYPDISDQAERYKKYADNLERMKASGRMN